MATITKTPSDTWKALVRKTGWPTTIKTFRTKRNAEDWARRTEDEMVRGAFIQRAAGDRMTVAAALERYLAEVVPTKRPTSQVADRKRAKVLTEHLGKYSLAALTPEVIAKFRDARLAGEDRKDETGNPQPRMNNTVRLDLALLGHMYTIAIKEWGVGLPANPVANIRRPAPGPGRNRRLTAQEEAKLLAAVDAYPCLPSPGVPCYGLLRRPSRLEINSLRSALTAAAASQKITRYPGKGKHQI